MDPREQRELEEIMEFVLLKSVTGSELNFTLLHVKSKVVRLGSPT